MIEHISLFSDAAILIVVVSFFFFLDYITDILRRKVEKNQSAPFKKHSRESQPWDAWPSPLS